MKLPSDLREFIELLNSHGVDYVLVGGHAVAYHGYPRYTGDMDFFVRPSPDNATRLLAALSDFGFAGTELCADDFCRPDQIVQLGNPPLRIDLLTSISGVEFEEAWQTRILADLDGQPVPIIGLTQLLKNKRASGRVKDLADIEQLE